MILLYVRKYIDTLGSRFTLSRSTVKTSVNFHFFLELLDPNKHWQMPANPSNLLLTVQIVKISMNTANALTCCKFVF